MLPLLLLLVFFASFVTSSFSHSIIHGRGDPTPTFQFIAKDDSPASHTAVSPPIPHCGINDSYNSNNDNSNNNDNNTQCPVLAAFLSKLLIIEQAFCVKERT